MTYLRILIAGIFFIQLNACNSPSGGSVYHDDPKEKDPCQEVPRVEWNHVESGYDKKTTLDLATKLQAAIRLDSQSLKKIGNGDASADVSLQVTKLFTQNEYKVANVSQEIFDQGIAFRTTVCNLWALIKHGNLTESQKDQVITQMLNYSKKFNEIEVTEKKNLASE